MCAEGNGMAAEQARGAELAAAAESLLVEARVDAIDAAHAVQLATASALLALYWELRHRRPGAAVDAAVRGRPYRRQWATEPGA